MWYIVVIIPKCDGDFRGIGFVKVLWKALSGVVISGSGRKFTFITYSTGSGKVGLEVPPPLKPIFSVS